MIKLHTQNEHQQEETIRRVRNGKYDKGTVIEYHVGDYADQIGAKKIGRVMRDLFDAGKVALAQKRIQDDPRQYCYWGIVR